MRWCPFGSFHHFAIGYRQLAILSNNLGRLEDAENYFNQALSHPEGMTERERFITRAAYNSWKGDYQQCAKIYGEMLARYPADAVAHNNRASCLATIGNMRGAADEIRQALQVAPARVVYRTNLALFTAYAGDFQAAEHEARSISNPNAFAHVALAFAQVGQNHLREAMDTYVKLAALGPDAASLAADGLAHLALYEGRLSDAVRLFEQGAADDLNINKNADRAARKLVSLASVHLLRGQPGPATAEVKKALLASVSEDVQFMAARVFVEVGDLASARTLAAGLASSDSSFLDSSEKANAYRRIIQGEIALKSRDPRRAIRILSGVNTVVDRLLGHFDLGRAYLGVGANALADAEFDLLIKRRGEALSLLLDMEPTYGFFATVLQGKRPR